LNRSLSGIHKSSIRDHSNDIGLIGLVCEDEWPPIDADPPICRCACGTFMITGGSVFVMR
jgi:hypothetical protein